MAAARRDEEKPEENDEKDEAPAEGVETTDVGENDIRHRVRDARTAFEKRGPVVVGNWKVFHNGKHHRVTHGTPAEGLPKAIVDKLKKAGAQIEVVEDSSQAKVGKPSKIVQYTTAKPRG